MNQLMNTLNGSNLFYIEAILNIYNVNTEICDEIRREVQTFDNNVINFEEIEQKCRHPNEKKKPFGLKLNKKLYHIKWSCDVDFKNYKGSEPNYDDYTIDFHTPIFEKVGSYYYDEYSDLDIRGSNNFLHVNMFNINDDIPIYYAQYKLFIKGIKFGGRKYRFLGGEIQKQKKDTSNNNDNSSNNTNNTNNANIALWFVAADSIEKVVSIRNFLGNFKDTSNIKLNSRLKLGFSKSLAYGSFTDDQIILIDDIKSDNKDEIERNIMSDGCGFISVSDK